MRAGLNMFLAMQPRKHVEVQSEVRKFIVDNFLFGDVAAAPANEQQLVHSGVVDSTGILELVAFLETRFGLEIADEELTFQNFGTIEMIAGFVLTKAA
jgi:acyl carrier protein